MSKIIILLLESHYSGESLFQDFERDIESVVHENDEIPIDEYGFYKGKFTITVTWEPDSE